MSGRSATSLNPARSAPVSEIKHVVELRARVNQALRTMLDEQDSGADQIHAAMRQALLSGGKRIRPLLTLLSAEHLGCSISRAMPAACALELVHAASLVLDDLPCMDNSASRRGQPTIHMKYGQDIAILTGVALLTQAFGALAAAPGITDSARLMMVAILARAAGAAGLVGGQVKDLRAPARSMEAVREMHVQKTSSLFMASVELGAIAGGASAHAIGALRLFAEDLGLAFQALDDLHDEADDHVSGGSSMLTILGQSALRQEAETRMAGAKAALLGGDPRLLPMRVYVDLLLGQTDRRPSHG